jgi:ADP-ribosylglycohydrolase
MVTDDTDQMLLIMDSLLANAGHINTVDFAARLRFWVDHVCPLKFPSGSLNRNKIAKN